MSSANEPVIRSLWATRSGSDPSTKTDLTGFTSDPSANAEDRLLSELDGIHLHYSFPLSTSFSDLALEALGTGLIVRIRAALLKIGLTEFIEDQGSFVAIRRESKEGQ